MGHRLGTNRVLRVSQAQPHKCPCGKQVDARGLRGLACRKATARQQRHSHLNEILWRSTKRAQVPATREPVGRFRSDGKRPDRATQIPWARSKPLAWDVTVPDTYADSHINSTSITAGAAANHAETTKSAKYANLTSTHIFVSFVIETSGAWNAQAIELTQEIGRRKTTVTGDPLETIHLFQRLSIAIQQANATVSFTSTFKSE